LNVSFEKHIDGIIKIINKIISFLIIFSPS